MDRERNVIEKMLKSHADSRAWLDAEQAKVDEIYESSRNRILATIIAHVTGKARAPLNGAALVSLLEQLQKRYADLETAIRAEMKYALPYMAQSYYLMALNDIDPKLSKSALINALDNRRIDNAFDDVYDHIAGATRKMSETHTAWLRRISAKIFREASLTGESKAEIARKLLSEATTVPSFQFIDKAGRPWSHKNYFEMLTRTVLMNAGRSSYLDACAEKGYDLVRVTVSGHPCPNCAVYENRLLSISGKNKEFPTVEEATAKGLFHPNCTHSLVAVHEEDAKRKFDEKGYPKTGYKPPRESEAKTPEKWKEYRAMKATPKPKATN